MLTENELIPDINRAQLLNKARIHSLRMVHKAEASHIGSCLSMAHLLTSLYSGILKVDPSTVNSPNRDRFILSKGHGAAILYAILAERGFFPLEWLEGYSQNNTLLMGHVSHFVPGIEVSTGSLGHGLPIACGIALAGKRTQFNYRVFVLLGDGELDEGSNWESMLFAAHHKLDNLVAIVDHNKIQGFGSIKDVLDLTPLSDKLKAFGWVVKEIDGHNFKEIENALSDIPGEVNRPCFIIANTIKGKGVSFMENNLAWHYKSPNDEQLEQAIREINEIP